MRGKNEENIATGDEEQGYLVSVSDLMAGLLFLFTIALAVFALNFKFAETKQKVAQDEHVREKERLEQIVDQLLGTRERRARMLRRIEQEAQKYNLNVTINEEQGILHLQEGILFDSGSAALKPNGQENLKILAKIFCEVLPGYLCSPQSVGDERTMAKVGTIETVFIEGHTDRQPIKPGSRFQDNLELSAARARSTFRFLDENARELLGLKNGDGQYIFCLSGYGEHRPVKTYEGPDDVKENRRIDFRFVMFPPQADPKLIQELEERLKTPKEES